MRARFYSPTLGRFTQADPIGIAGGLGIYTYSFNSPTIDIDPIGLSADCPSGGPPLTPKDLDDAWRDFYKGVAFAGVGVAAALFGEVPGAVIGIGLTLWGGTRSSIMVRL